MEPAPSQHLIHTEGDETTHESGPLWGQGCQGQGHPGVRTTPRSRPVDPETGTEFIGYGHGVQPMRLPPAALCCSIREHPQLCQQTGKYSCLFHEQICKRQDSLSNLRDRPQQIDICLKTAFHRDLQKCKTILFFFPFFFLLGKQLYFLKNVLFLLTMGLLHHLHKQSSLRSSIIVKNTKGGSGVKKLENSGLTLHAGWSGTQHPTKAGPAGVARPLLTEPGGLGDRADTWSSCKATDALLALLGTWETKSFSSSSSGFSGPCAAPSCSSRTP